MKLGLYKFSKYPFVFIAYAHKEEIVLKLPFTLFNIKLSKLQFHGALRLGHLDRHI